MPLDPDEPLGPLVITVDQALADAGVTVRLDCALIDVTGSLALSALADRLAAAAAEMDIETASIASLPRVAATRDAYRALGKDPARYRPSSEALLRRIAQGKDLPRVNALVDAGNLASISTAWPIGFYDVEKLRPPIRLRPGMPGESYDAIGRGPMNLAGLPLLADASGPFGSPTSDSARTSLQDDAAQALFVVFCFGDAAPDDDALAVVGDAVAATGIGRLTARWSVAGGPEA